MNDPMPACCVCKDHQVPRRAVLTNADDSVILAAVCVNPAWCQARAAGNLLSGLARSPDVNYHAP